MSGLSKLGITLTSVFSLLLLALLAELLYLFWRRRQQLRRKSNRVEPTSSTAAASSHSQFLKFESTYGSVPPPSRVLFTIKEEEKDDEIDIDIDDHQLPSSTNLVPNHKNLPMVTTLGDHFGNFHFQLTPTGGGAGGGGDESPPEIIIMVGDSDFDVEPPFLTPCTSPPYFTPSPSPTREERV